MFCSQRIFYLRNPFRSNKYFIAKPKTKKFWNGKIDLREGKITNVDINEMEEEILGLHRSGW